MLEQIKKYIEMLNATRFLGGSPIGEEEMNRFIERFGEEDYLHTLKRWYNEHFGYDKETL